MKRLVLLSTLLTLLLSACGSDSTSAAPTPAEESLPILVVDADHFLTPNLFYEIPAGAGFVLDASTYVFGTAAGPTAVSVIVDGREYQGRWTAADNIQPVRAAHLVPPPGLKPLSGFAAGKQLIVAIGSLSPQGTFETMWLAAVNVY
jgi:hypothetical protein